MEQKQFEQLMQRLDSLENQNKNLTALVEILSSVVGVDAEIIEKLRQRSDLKLKHVMTSERQN
jgi:hypothetical protein